MIPNCPALRNYVLNVLQLIRLVRRFHRVCDPLTEIIGLSDFRYADYGPQKLRRLNFLLGSRNKMWNHEIC